MGKTTRREFVKYTGMGVAAASFAPFIKGADKKRLIPALNEIGLPLERV